MIKHCLKNKFLPPDYIYCILEELQRQTQHPEGSIRIHSDLAAVIQYRRDYCDRKAESSTGHLTAPRMLSVLSMSLPNFDTLETMAQEAHTTQCDFLAELNHCLSASSEGSLELRCTWTAGITSVECLPAAGLGCNFRVSYSTGPTCLPVDPFKFVWGLVRTDAGHDKIYTAAATTW